MNLKIYKYEDLAAAELSNLMARPKLYTDEEKLKVLEIIAAVESEGDQAVLRYTKQLDEVELKAIEADSAEWEQALLNVSHESWSSLKAAARNIEAFHSLQIPQSTETETVPGVYCRREWRALQTAGLYAPGGSAPLISTVLMLGIPARIAGCEQIILCSPPDKTGTLKPEMFAAAKIAGVHRVFKTGGAQAIAAMAIGTKSIPKVNKIFGPGNRFVAAAKSIVSGYPYRTGVDMVAGPSELMLIADGNANPAWIAADLLTQTEHGPDSQVILVSTSDDLIRSVNLALESSLQKLPRKELSGRSLAGSFALHVKNTDAAVELANLYAPEHLMICTADAENFAKSIHNAGSVFLGYQSSVVFGDYISGTNHTLPTGGTAVYRGGLCVEDFMKPVSFQSISASGAAAVADDAARLARLEGLEGHALAATLRQSSSNSTTDPVRISIDRLVRKQFRTFKPYVSARSESINGSIYLDANELSCMDESRVRGSVAFNRYPDPHHKKLRTRLAAINSAPVESIFCGNGSDEIIDLLIRLFCDPGKDAIGVLEPTYGVYEVTARVHGCNVVHLSLDDNFQFNAETILEKLPPSVKLIFCCSPNNPTGNLLKRDEVFKLARGFRGVVIVDEAYMDFSDARSFVESAASSENLVVLRTLSKAWGLAGIRVGYCIAAPALVSFLMRIKPPYNISALSLQEAISALEQPELTAKAISLVVQERERLCSELQTHQSVIKVFESHGNFLLVRFQNAGKAYDLLLKKGIVVRRRSEERLFDCLRITVGSPAENDLVIQTLSDLR